MSPGQDSPDRGLLISWAIQFSMVQKNNNP
jgi:hypothetical protein